ncbi:MAG: glutathione S-transferase family protein [Pseudomonadota bacterium]
MISDKIDAELFNEVVNATNARLKSSYSNKLVGEAAGGKPRFELYHSGPSLCSHKCRTTLAEKGIPYMSHDMSIMPVGKAVPQNYRPSYVRMRLLAASNHNFASSYNGESSVTNQGLDPCVVPTLLDHQEHRVVVDSQQICEYLDANAGELNSLVPENQRDAIMAQIALVDQAPHVAFLYGQHPEEDNRPEGVRKNLTGVHAKKNRVLAAILKLPEVANDPVLKAAYESKIAKEDAAAAFTCDEESMRETYRMMATHVDTLEAALESHSGQFVLGDEYTMADMMWVISLYRLKWGGLARLWEDQDRPKLQQYLQREFERPSFRSAIVDWPGAYGPSPHVTEFADAAAQKRFMRHMRKKISLWEIFIGDRKVRFA